MKMNFIDKYGSTILTFLGATGVIATGYLTARASFNAMEEIEIEEQHTGELIDKKEKAKIYVKHFAVPAAVGAATVGTIFGAHILDKKQQAVLTTSYAMLNEYHKAYRQKNIEINGEEADEKVVDALARERCDYHRIDMTCPDAKMTFVDDISGDEIIAYERDIIDAEYHLNMNYALSGGVTVNMWRAMLGLPLKPEYDDIGWSMDGIYWLDFEHKKEPDGRVRIISMFSPEDADIDNSYFPWATAYPRE